MRKPTEQQSSRQPGTGTRRQQLFPLAGKHSPHLETRHPTYEPICTEGPSRPKDKPVLSASIPPTNLAITSMKGCLYATLPLITPRVCGIPPPVINGIFFTSQETNIRIPTLTEKRKVPIPFRMRIKEVMAKIEEELKQVMIRHSNKPRQ